MQNELEERANQCVYRWAQTYNSAHGILSLLESKRPGSASANALFNSLFGLRSLEILFQELYYIYQITPHDGSEGFIPRVTHEAIDGLFKGLVLLGDNNIQILTGIYGLSFAPPIFKFIPGGIGRNLQINDQTKKYINICFAVAVGMGIKELFESTKENRESCISDTVAYTFKTEVEQAITDWVIAISK